MVNEAWLIIPKQVPASEEDEEQLICLGDLQVVIMAILRLNDGHHFIEPEEEPAPAQVTFGVRGDKGQLQLRYDEVQKIQKDFQPYYMNHLQF